MSENKKFILSAFEKTVILLALVLLIISFFYDDQILISLVQIRTPWLNSFMSFMTNRGLFVLTTLLGIYLIVTKKYLQLALMVLTVAISMESGFVLKKIFMRERPFMREVLATISIAQTIGYAFPSLHATFCFSLWPHFKRTFNHFTFRLIGYLFVLIIVFSRIYVGVHYFSDLLGGAIIGFITAKTIIYLQDRYKIIQWFIFQVKDKFELRRQFGHLFTGLAIALLYRYNLINAAVLLGILIIGGILSLLSRKYKIPGIYHALLFFERSKDLHYFPGKGSFFLVLGSFLSIVIFPKDLALAAITIMAIGDAITTIIGTYFGRIKNPLNPSKHLEGTILAIIISTIAAFSFVSFEKAFIGSVVGMIFESFTIRFLDRIIDDNILIPLIAGLAMMMLA